MTGNAAGLCHFRLRSAAVSLFLAMVAIATYPSAAARAEDALFASVGSGELSGVYYPVTQAICQIVNRDLNTQGVRCSPESTPGSVYNIAALESGELEFAIVQADVQYAAYYGKGPWAGKPFLGLRSVFSLYPELVTVMTRADSGITDLAGLMGRRVNVGSRGSGTRATWDAIETALGWSGKQRVRPVELKGEASTSALCRGEIAAILLIVGHPSPLVTAQQAACPISFVAIAGPTIDKLIRNHPYYQRDSIPGGLYGLTAEVPTFGGRASLVTSTSVDAQLVTVFAKDVLSDIPEFRTLNPVLAGLKAREMIYDGLIAPLHPAAAEIYKTLGLSE
jgi:uncharacterized protein